MHQEDNSVMHGKMNIVDGTIIAVHDGSEPTGSTTWRISTHLDESIINIAELQSICTTEKEYLTEDPIVTAYFALLRPSSRSLLRSSFSCSSSNFAWAISRRLRASYA